MAAWFVGWSLIIVLHLTILHEEKMELRSSCILAQVLNGYSVLGIISSLVVPISLVQGINYYILVRIITSCLKTLTLADNS
jgi:hypothetical protein